MTEYDIMGKNIEFFPQHAGVVKEETPCICCLAYAYLMHDLAVNLCTWRNRDRPAASF